jgi:hypothetical protein
VGKAPPTVAGFDHTRVQKQMTKQSSDNETWDTTDVVLNRDRNEIKLPVPFASKTC